jgi:hypothetical protein
MEDLCETGCSTPTIPRIDLSKAEKFRDVGDPKEDAWFDGFWWFWEDVKSQWRKFNQWKFSRMTV